MVGKEYVIDGRGWLVEDIAPDPHWGCDVVEASAFIGDFGWGVGRRIACRWRLEDFRFMTLTSPSQ